MLTAKKLRLVLAAALLLATLSAQAAPRPRNVILLIGDGMGLAHVSLARLSSGDPATVLQMDSMRYAAFVKTQSADPEKGRGIITDSAASATALATGYKTKNGMLGVLPDGKPVRSILEAAQGIGKSVGLVTTVTITHATPAGFGAHEAARGDEDAIAPQYLAKRIDVLLGGGEQFFLPKSAKDSKRKDERDLLAEARKAGYTVARTADELAKANGKRLLGLFELGYLTTNPPEPSLADMASKAIEMLARNQRGFFVMIEGGQIDSGGHANNEAVVLKQTLDFDEAVGVALKFARERGDTLVLVTADHETGGLSLVSPPSTSKAEFHSAWGTKGHSAIAVPLLADGPGAERFSGVYDNTDIPKRIADLWRVKLGELPAGDAK